MNLNVEANTLNQVFAEHRAGVWAVLVHPQKQTPMVMVTPAYTIYRLLPWQPGVKMAAIRALLPELQSALSRGRKEKVRIRFDEQAFALEVPRAQPGILPFTEKAYASLQEFDALLGQSYAFGKAHRQIISLANPEKAHILIAGTTRSGKTAMKRTIISSLAMSTPPAKLQFVMIDLKNRGLVPFQRLPHVRGWTANADEAASYIRWVAAELQRRIDNESSAPEPRIILAIDELAQLAFTGIADVFESAFPDIATRGGELGIHLLVSAQNPSKEILGSQMRSQFTTKIIGHLEDARTANFVTGRVASGAEKLPGQGAMLLIEGGADPLRIQGYLIEDMQPIIERIRAKWGNVTLPPIVPVEKPKRGRQARRDIQEDVAKAKPVFEKFYQWWVGGGGLRDGGKKAIIEAIFGEGALTGGYNDRYADEVIRHLEQEMYARAN